MKRTKIRWVLFIVVVITVGWLAWASALGAAEQPQPLCERIGVAPAALSLAQGGEVAAAREMVVADLERIDDSRTLPTLLVDPPEAVLNGPRVAQGSAGAVIDEGTCGRQLLRWLQAESFSGRVVAGTGILVQSVVDLEWPGNVADDRDLGLALSDGTSRTVRTAVWVIPVIVALFVLRERTIAKMDRRPGPVDVLPIVNRLPKAEEPNDPIFRARFARYLAELKISPRGFTEGGIGELIVPVVESSEASPDVLGTLARLTRRLVLPDGGFEVASVIHRDDKGDKSSEWILNLEIKARRSRVLVEAEELRASTPHRLAALAAAHTYQQVVELESIEPGIPVWANWHSKDDLADFVETVQSSRGDESSPFERLISRQPANLALRIHAANEHYNAARDLRSSMEPRLAAIHLRDLTEHLLTACQLAPQLIEPKLHLIHALSTSERWVEILRVDDPARSKSTAAMLLAFLETEPQLTGPGVRLVRQACDNGQLPKAADLILLASDVAKRGLRQANLLQVLRLYGNRPTRSSVPGRLLWPLSASRAQTQILLKSLSLYHECRSLQGSDLRHRISVARSQLDALSARIRRRKRVNNWSARFNLALGYGYLAAHSVEPSGKSFYRKKMVKLLHSQFGAEGRLPRFHIQKLQTDPDLESHRGEVSAWLDGLGLTQPQDVGRARTSGWQHLLDVLDSRLASWTTFVSDLDSWPPRPTKPASTKRLVQELIHDRRTIADQIGWWTAGGDPYVRPAKPPGFAKSQWRVPQEVVDLLPLGHDVDLDLPSEKDLPDAGLKALDGPDPMPLEDIRKHAAVQHSAWLRAVEQVREKSNAELGSATPEIGT